MTEQEFQEFIAKCEERFTHHGVIKLPFSWGQTPDSLQFDERITDEQRAKIEQAFAEVFE
jgi:hypothetical protein